MSFVSVIKDHPTLVKAPSCKSRSHQALAQTITDQFYDLLPNIVANESQHMFGKFKHKGMNQRMNITHILKNTISKSQNKSHKKKITL